MTKQTSRAEALASCRDTYDRLHATVLQADPIDLGKIVTSLYVEAERDHGPVLWYVMIRLREQGARIADLEAQLKERG